MWGDDVCLRHFLDFGTYANTDQVNVASRMESSCPEGFIQVTRVAYKCMKHQFEFEKRGIIPVKGKGDMKTYFLKALKSRYPLL